MKNACVLAAFLLAVAATSALAQPQDTAVATSETIFGTGGKVVIKNPDGTTTTVYCPIESDKVCAIITTNPDGSGSETIFGAGGKVVTRNPDGSTTTVTCPLESERVCAIIPVPAPVVIGVGANIRVVPGRSEISIFRPDGTAQRYVREAGSAALRAIDEVQGGTAGALK